MDLRIVNTCNNNCIYCLEQWLRRKRKFIKKEEIFEKLEAEKNKEILCFFGWNPLLHPDLEEIIIFARNNGFKNITLLTNTFWISEEFLQKLKNAWLNGISFYFNSFSEEKQNIITNFGITLKDLLKNILIIQKFWILNKCIIHVNNQNIDEIPKNILLLKQKFWIKNFEFVKYNLVSRAGKKYRELLEFDKIKEKIFFEKISILREKMKINFSFKKF